MLPDGGNPSAGDAAMNPSWQRSAAFYQQLSGYGFSIGRGSRETTAIQIVAAVASIRQVMDAFKILRVLQPVKGNTTDMGKAGWGARFD